MRISVRRLAVVTAVGALAAAASATAATSAPGQLDSSFGRGAGYVATSFPNPAFADGLVMQGDKTIVVGSVDNTANGSSGDFAIVRYNKDGSLDNSFGNGGKVVVDFGGNDDLASAVTLQGGKIVVVGYTSPDDNNFSFALARLESNGKLDKSFGNGGKVVVGFNDGYDFADAVTTTSDKIVVAGSTQAGTGGDNFVVARFNNNGALDTTFGSGGKVVTDFAGGFDAANGVAMMGDSILAAGYVQEPTGSDFGLVRYTKTGALDTTFGQGGKTTTDFGHGDDYGHSVSVNGDRILVVGSASNGSDQDFAAAVYTKNGVLDPSFSGNGKATIAGAGDDEAFGGALANDGSVVAGGASNGAFAVARWTKAGAIDSTFGNGGMETTPIGGDSAAFALALGPGNTIVLGGYSDDSFAVARYLSH